MLGHLRHNVDVLSHQVWAVPAQPGRGMTVGIALSVAYAMESREFTALAISHDPVTSPLTLGLLGTSTG